MERKEFLEALFKAGKAAGLCELEAFYKENESFELQVFEGEIDKYNLSATGGLSLRGVWQNEMGYAYSEILDEKAVELLIKGVKESAEVCTREDKEVIFAGSPEYTPVKTYYEGLEQVSAEDKIEFALRLERCAKAVDPRIGKVEVYYGNEKSVTELKNSLGLELADRSNAAFAYVVAIASEGEKVQTGFEFAVATEFDQLNAEELAKKAAERAISMLDATSMPKGQCSVVLDSLVSGDILSSFSGIFSALSVDRGLSLLAGKLQTQIADAKVTLIDNPHLPEGLASASFDGEGVATIYKEIIKDGILQSYLHNLKTAAKFGVASTGNASKPSYKAQVDIAPSNMYFKQGCKSLDELLALAGSGLYVTDVQGLHAGLNPVSGDFSLSASGYLIENGKKGRPVNQITIAGNYLELLKNVDELGNDLRFGFPGGSYIGSPSMLVKSLNVAGE